MLNSTRAVLAALVEMPLDSLQAINVKDTSLDKNVRSVLLQCL